jgi:hypothetical protein
MTSLDTRIQLEGQLEVVEVAIAGLRVAVTSLGDDEQWLHDPRWHPRHDPRLAHALNVCRNRVGDDDGVERCFSELMALRAQLSELARSRLRQLRLPIERGPVAALQSHLPLVVHPDAVRPARPRLWFDANPSPDVLRGLEERTVGTVVSGVAWLAAHALRKPKPYLLITRRSVVIEQCLFSWAEVIRVTTEHLHDDSWAVTFWVTTAPSITLDLAGDVLEWMVTLRAMGVVVA